MGMSLTHRARRLALAAALALALSSGVGVPAAAQQGPQPGAAGSPRVEARAALLVDAETGQVLWSHNPDEPVPPASLAKVLALDLVFHELKAGRLSLDQEVTVSEAAWRLSVQAGRGGPSAMFLGLGEQVKVVDLIRGVAVASGNDAATALAEAVAGSEEAFVQRMNQHAREIGMTHSRFANSHGLPGGEQFVTARDMATLALHVLRETPEMLEYTREKYLRWKNFAPQPNYNGLVFRDDRVDGLKTGHTAEAGFHLVATAREGDRRLVAVVLGAGSNEQRLQEAEALLNFGFEGFVREAVSFGDGGSRLLPVYKGKGRSVEVVPAVEPVVVIPKEMSGRLKVEERLDDPLVAPLPKGAPVGMLIIKGPDGTELRRVALVTASEVPRGGFIRVMFDSLRLLLKNLFG
ncbi:MAG: D-alanyl-D-alanine carboxypeptidase [Bacillota bacterium]|nr:MAG: D-alanyl-D-alanine carboxypeptidase [Bacillota bacterium]